MKRNLLRFLCAALALALLCVPLPSAAQAADTAHKLIAFTFDDGPGESTARLLDGLEERGVVATFFMNGSNGGNGLHHYNAMLERMLALGCQCANHTDRHLQFLRLGAGEMRREVSAVENYLYAAAGAPYTELVRVPYGQNSAAIRAAVDRPMILWSVDTRDWESRNADAVCEAIRKDAFDGAIVLMHDIYGSTVDGALRAIDLLREDGYEFVTVSELFRRRGIELENGRVYRSAPNEGVTLAPYGAPELTVTADDLDGVTFVTVASEEEGLTFHYTTDGSAPTLASPVYTAPLRLTANAELRVVGYDRFATRTKEASCSIVARVAKPQIIEETNGAIRLYCDTPDVTYYCTTDGSDPLTAGTACTEPIQTGELTRIVARKGDMRPSLELTVVRTAHGSLFRDVTPNAAYLEAVDDVVERGLMSGTDGFRFAPQRTTSRAEMAAILYRLAGKPTAETPDVFYDVPQGAWYANAIGWANASGVLQGVSPHYFRPDVALSRQQAAVALYRFAAYAGLNTKLPADDEASFPDADDYAQDALRWCAASGIPCHGQTALTAPVSRADWAVMLSAFCKLFPN